MLRACSSNILTTRVVAVDDEYLYGSSMLVAPLMHELSLAATCIFPPGIGFDYQSGHAYSGGWQHIEAGKIPEIILVRNGTVLPHIQLAQSTLQMDWSKLELVIYAKDATSAKGLVCLPSDNTLRELSLDKAGATFK